MILKIADKSELKSIKKLYKQAFPIGERMPFWKMIRSQKRGFTEILYIDDNGFAGLAISMIYGDLVLLNYFAVAPNVRGQGVGSRAIKLIIERYLPKRFVLEIEKPEEGAPNNEQRVKRKSFYLKNGMTDAKKDVSVFGIEMELLTANCTDDNPIEFDEYQNLYVKTLGKAYKSMIKPK